MEQNFGNRGLRDLPWFRHFVVCLNVESLYRSSKAVLQFEKKEMTRKENPGMVTSSLLVTYLPFGHLLAFCHHGTFQAS